MGDQRDGGEADLAEVAALRGTSWDDTYRPVIGNDAIDRLVDLRDHRRGIEGMLRDPRHCSWSRRMEITCSLDSR